MDEIEAEDGDHGDPVDVFMSLDSWPTPQADTFLVGFLIVNVVGLRYYQGTISGREIVGLVREELNPHDGNAIKVLNMLSLQVGHIERRAAAVLSPLIDSRLITIEGIIPKPPGKGNKFNMPCQVHIFARIEDFDRVKMAISRGGLLLISENNPSFTLSQAMAVKETKSILEEKSIDEIFKLLDVKVSKAGLSEPLEPPKDMIKSELFLHQKEGLGWLVSRETSCELPPFWLEENGVYINELTNYQTNKRPEPLQGGIFADDMGLGKTLTLLSLIAFDKSARGINSSSSIADVDDEASSEKSKRRSGKRKADILGKKRKAEDVAKKNGKRPAFDNSCSLEPKTTLIVCPPSVFSSWMTQLEEHTRKGAFKVYMYYGERTTDAKELLEHDIVLTTYSTLGTEESWEDSPIKKIEWRRVLLDEAHMIRNAKTQQSRAVTNLNAKRRWAITGTPVQNNSHDLFSLVAFLKFEPLSVKDLWNRLIQRPLTQGDENGISRLQVLMAAISLRRTKEQGLVGLPSKSIETLLVDLGDEERKVYDQMEEEARNIVKDFIHSENVIRHYSTVLSILVRLRQICTDLALCPADLRALLPQSQIEDVNNNPTLLKKLLAVLQDGEDFDCPICISPPTDIIITCCAHIFCESCILKTLKRTRACCPMCRHPLSESDLFKSPPEASSDQVPSPTRSSKVAALLKLLTGSRDADPSSKSVIFSQFRKMLLLLEEPLKEAGFNVIRLDGSMNAKKRSQVIKDFGVPASEGGPTIMLASLKAANAGINLTAASTVYLMEPWWNPAVEEQAMDRVHRIGQKRDVKIVRLIARDTIDERILQLQEKKRTLAKKAFGRRAQREINTKDIAALMKL